MGIKAWHVIAFSFVPLFLVFLGVLTGAFRGTGSAEQVLAPPPTRGPEEPRPTPSDTESVVEIVAEDIQFDPRALTVRANTDVTIVFDNRDAGVLHNVAVYDSPQVREKIFVGEIFAGPATVEYTFTAPSAGSYFFRCDVHPNQMTGTFIVQ